MVQQPGRGGKHSVWIVVSQSHGIRIRDHGGKGSMERQTAQPRPAPPAGRHSNVRQ
jgi:hypothetical protein